ncbi:hypothetical protein [Bacillus sp. N1-1]|jgi:hypothetical protein|uniref:hypothetical protein n=1 Tax=Bacillus sp. N1-1 TaxID=2682541 RepID=UPI001315E800|nr:hypothetical protein [Bacillus sp. N1-1]QHA90866.1 hypothetical protein GNK04_05160 [Bacillus sp. N1-1]
MKIKSISTLVLVGVFALSVGSLKDLQSTEVLAQNDRPKVEAVQAFSNEGDVIRVVTAEEQNMIESSAVSSGFLQQGNGTGVFFEKVK